MMTVIVMMMTNTIPKLANQLSWAINYRACLYLTQSFQNLPFFSFYILFIQLGMSLKEMAGFLQFLYLSVATEPLWLNHWSSGVQRTWIYFERTSLQFWNKFLVWYRIFQTTFILIIITIYMVPNISQKWKWAQRTTSKYFCLKWSICTLWNSCLIPLDIGPLEKYKVF